MTRLQDMRSTYKSLALEGIPVKVAILGDFTINHIKEPLGVLLHEAGFKGDFYLSGYKQWAQELLEVKSSLLSFQPEVIFLALSTRTYLSEVEFVPEKISYVSEKIDELRQILKNTSFKGKFILTTFERIVHSDIGDINRDDGISAALIHANGELRTLAVDMPNLVLLDMESIQTQIGAQNFIDAKLFTLGKILYSESTLLRVAENVVQCIKATYGMMSKCIVVDLDNTLWGGVIGEDGIEGIELSDDGLGGVYREVQLLLKAFRDRGILLAIVSKNNEQDVEPMFAHEWMVLKKEDFAAVRINWESKSKNICSIAQELNLGVSSFVFLDDSLMERLEVAQSHPDIEIIDFPGDIVKLPDVLRALPYFPQLQLTEEDRVRHTMYEAQKVRSEAQFTSADYLSSLQTRISIRKNDFAKLPRITQLINKTNQFNLRTVRRDEFAVKNLMENEDFSVYSVDVWDKCGALGLTAVLILERKEAHTFFIESFLMSCRVLSRGIEKKLLQEICRNLPTSSKVLAEYRSSPKNALVAGFYETCGFILKETVSTSKLYEAQVETICVEPVEWIEVFSDGKTHI